MGCALLFAACIRTEITEWTKLIEDARIRPDLTSNGTTPMQSNQRHDARRHFRSCSAMHAAACIALTALAGPGLAAETFPARPVRIIVPFPPGGGTDILARALAPRMTEALGQSVVVENRAGAGGQVGIEVAAKSAADGHVVLLVSGSLTILPSLTRVRYDPLRDFAPITLATRQPYAAVVHPSLPARDMRELIALARARPGQVTYASAGSGGAGHLGVELLKTMAKIDLVHVPYKGSGPALIDLLGGHVTMMFASAPSSAPHVRTQRLRALGVTSAGPSAVMPGVPPVAQSGLTGFEVYGWYGLLVPAGTPPDVVARLNAVITRALASPDVRERILADGSEPIGGSPAQFADYLRADVPKWAKVIRDSGARAD
jgi:tripartite-type tricarboxylate transporter receptor subunit TctC